MTPGEIEIFTKHLCDHFSFVTDGDAELLWSLLKRFSLPTSCKAVERHRLDCGMRADRPNPKAVAAIAARLAEQSAVDAGGTMALRINGLSEDDRQRERERGHRVLNEREHARKVVASLEAAERERFRLAVLARMPADLRPMYERRDALSPVLAIGIAELMRAAQVAAELVGSRCKSEPSRGVGPGSPQSDAVNCVYGTFSERI